MKLNCRWQINEGRSSYFNCLKLFTTISKIEGKPDIYQFAERAAETFCTSALLSLLCHRNHYSCPTSLSYFTFVGTHKIAPLGKVWFHWIVTPFIIPTYSSFYCTSHQRDLKAVYFPKYLKWWPIQSLLHFRMLSRHLRILPLRKC